VSSDGYIVSREQDIMTTPHYIVSWQHDIVNRDYAISAQLKVLEMVRVGKPTLSLLWCRVYCTGIISWLVMDISWVESRISWLREISTSGRAWKGVKLSRCSGIYG